MDHGYNMDWQWVKEASTSSANILWKISMIYKTHESDLSHEAKEQTHLYQTSWFTSSRCEF